MVWYARFVTEPWSSLLGISSAMIVVPYIFSTSVALAYGSADFSLALKASLGFTFFLLLYYGIDDVRQAMMVRQPRVISRVQSLVLLIVGFVLVIAGVLKFFASASLSASLSLDPVVRAIAAVGLIPPAIFSIVEFYRAAEILGKAIRRKP